VPRRGELAGPEPALRSPRFVLFVHVVVAVATIRERESRAHHLGVDVRAALLADGDLAAVVVGVARRAAQRGASDEAAQLRGRVLSAAPCLVVAPAVLATFRR